MLPVPIDAASAVMNAWNGVSTPPRRRVAAADERAQRLAEAPHLHDAERSVRKRPVPNSTTHEPRHEQPVGRGLNQSASCQADQSCCAREST